MPSRFGPRHCGQSSAWARQGNKNTTAKTTPNCARHQLEENERRIRGREVIFDMNWLTLGMLIEFKGTEDFGRYVWLPGGVRRSTTSQTGSPCVSSGCVCPGTLPAAPQAMDLLRLDEPIKPVPDGWFDDDGFGGTIVGRRRGDRRPGPTRRVRVLLQYVAGREGWPRQRHRVGRR